MNIYDTNALIQVVPNLKTSQNWLLDRFFTNVVEADTEEVSIDVDVGKRRMSPFVSPLVEGKLVEQRRYQTNTFKPAYIKDKRAPDLRKPVRRMIGERIGGVLSGAEREMANIQFEMADQIDMINRRMEWMASSALQSGTVTIAGDGFPTVVVDFGRDSGNTIALSGGTTWSAANITAETASPTGNLTTWAQQILKSSGATVSDVVFSTTAWELFKGDPLLKGAIYYPGLSGLGNVVQPGTEIKKGAMYMGRWGQFDLWIYNDWYVDDSNVEQPMLADNTLILSGPELMGTRAFGMILDPAFNYGAMAFAPKTWVEQDPAQRFIMMQSAPIVIPSRVNASLCATVA
ncbi:MAG TPA: major capsid protein [Rhizomicrobium sp.]|jgi:hypothetical protein|nr:major capsid protein [Rhizomicrobium sp.]